MRRRLSILLLLPVPWIAHAEVFESGMGMLFEADRPTAP